MDKIWLFIVSLVAVGYGIGHLEYKNSIGFIYILGGTLIQILMLIFGEYNKKTCN